MKIAIDCRFWGPEHTGLGRYTQNLVENLLKIDKKNNYILLLRKKDCKDLREDKRFNIKNLKLETVDCPHYSLKEQLLLPFILNKLKPDLVHFPHFNVPLFYSGKYLVTIHDLIKHYSKGLKTTTRQPFIYFIKYLAYKTVFKRAVKKAEKIITPSIDVKKQLEKIYPHTKGKTTAVYQGVDLNLKEDKDDLKNKSIINKYNIKKPYIVFTGNVYPHKNIRRLILAVKGINNSQKLNLVIVSARDIFLKRLKNTVNEFKASRFVILTSFVEDKDLGSIYSQAEAFTSPSLMEGFGLPGLEAMSFGCPVICSSIPVFKEVYNNGALYFNPENIDDIKAKVLKIIKLDKKERERLIKAGKEQVRKYSWKKTALQTLKIYEGCFSL